MIPDKLLHQYDEQGFIVVPGLFSSDEVETYKRHFMELNAAQHGERDERIQSYDPLAKYPRIMQPHRQETLSRDWLLDARLDQWLTALMGASPYAVQTMFYFKPPGARGQALHQDQFYLRVQPGTCMAAWMAVDRCDEENGCLEVVPGSHRFPVLCTIEADTTRSFTADTVPIPEGMQAVPVIMEPGDVLFFNGQVVHGSGPNTSTNRFRRAFIGHYIVAEAEKVARWYHPILRMDGSEVTLDTSEWGGTCGVWVTEDGVPVARLEGIETRQNYEAH
jgi:ectoine hydroxylase-related dioxygenase (phytanoyl-CoA dioxygenase family)